MKYSEFPQNLRPSKRLRELGAPSLSDSEALSVALFIGDSDTSQQLASLYQEYGSLGKIPRNRIKEISGLGDCYADAIQAIFELARRERMNEKPVRPVIHCPSDIANLVMLDMMALENEQVRVLVLNTRNEVIKNVVLYNGTVNSANVRVAEVFRDAIRENGAAIIFVHNHPTGDPTPSPEDIALTRTINQAGSTLEIDVLDHVIIGHNKFVSLKERGLIHK